MRSIVETARKKEVDEELFHMFQAAAKDWDDEDRRAHALWERASLEDFRRRENREDEE